MERGITETHSIITRLRRMPKPVIGSVRGAVAGFGMSLMSACDLVIAADSRLQCSGGRRSRSVLES
ncbi:MAG: enoyl-CoA hydratase-related protein [Comamonadaceae bacterium]